VFHKRRALPGKSTKEKATIRTTRCPLPARQGSRAFTATADDVLVTATSRQHLGDDTGAARIADGQHRRSGAVAAEVIDTGHRSRCRVW